MAKLHEERICVRCGVQHSSDEASDPMIRLMVIEDEPTEEDPDYEPEILWIHERCLNQHRGRG